MTMDQKFYLNLITSQPQHHQKQPKNNIAMIQKSGWTTEHNTEHQEDGLNKINNNDSERAWTRTDKSKA